MPEVVSFTAPHQVALVACEEQPLTPGSVRVRTWYSGISAGTELTAYRGSNPYLTGTWDPERRLFIEGEPTFGYPVNGWGYSEVGEVVEVADDVVSPAVRPPASQRSLRKNKTMIGTVRMTEPAISTVVGTSMLPAS